MPNTREKLIELQKEAIRAFMACQTDTPLVDFIADHLIANGVTVQQWIPVSEPPKPSRTKKSEQHRHSGRLD